MGIRAEEPITLTYDELVAHLRAKHSIYMHVDGHFLYLTDVNEHAWRSQDVEKLNEKGHYTDCSELVSTLSEFEGLPMYAGKTLQELLPDATFYESIPAK